MTPIDLVTFAMLLFIYARLEEKPGWAASFNLGGAILFAKAIFLEWS